MPHRGMERIDRQIDRERQNERQGMKRGCGACVSHVYACIRSIHVCVYTYREGMHKVHTSASREKKG